MSRKTTSPQKFEQSLEELEAIVTSLESGELSLEESLKVFEKGIQLTRGCQTALQEAEQKVQQLVDQNGKLEPFEPPEDA